MAAPIFRMIDNYIYLYHLDTFFVIPTFPETMQDQSSVSYAQTDIMGRSAPIYSYSHSGPRQISITLELHRDMMWQINYKLSNAIIPIGSDYVEQLVNGVQACAVPAYAVSQKMVDPPMVAVRFGDDIFIKGVVNGSVGVDYTPPILDTGKFANVKLAFTVNEVDPYDAQQAFRDGSLRGRDLMLEGAYWRKKS